MNIIYTKPKQNDIDNMQRIVKKAVEDGIILPRSDDEMATNIRSYIVAEFEKRIVGFTALHIHTKVLAEIRSLIVDENYRGLGIGKNLVIKAIEEGIGSSLKVIRIMPNTPALIGEGAFGISYNAHISDDDVELIRVLLNKLGRSFLLKEDLIDAVTALSGSGPAYVYLFIMALVDAGVKMGLSRDIAEGLVKQTIAGSIKFMEESSFNPYDLISYITSPGGTTIHALHTLHKSGFYSAVIDGVYSAYVRAKELSEEEIKK